MKNVTIVFDSLNQEFKKRLLKEIKNIHQSIEFSEYSIDIFNDRSEINIFLLDHFKSFKKLENLLEKNKHSTNILFTKNIFFMETVKMLDSGVLFGVFFFEQPISKSHQHITLALKLTHEKLKRFNLHKNTNDEILNKFRHELVFESKTMDAPLIEAFFAAKTEDNILILGQTGVGKELIAKSIHKNSKRENRSMLTLNCSNFTKELAESELFGHKQGSYTGATRDREGLLKRADGGTLFLDEIGDLDLEVQAKILRVLDQNANSRSFFPVGATEEVKSSVRIIAATSKPVSSEETSSFRKDLFYRFVWKISIPDLSERKEDIPALVKKFFEQNIKDKNTKLKNINSEVITRLIEKSWPGNIRELKHSIKRACTRSIQTNQNIELLIEDFNNELN